MRKIILTITLVVLCAGAAIAQEQNTRARTTAASRASVKQDNGAVSLQSGTRLTAQLQQTLDARKLKEGDQVVLKTTEAIKSEGQTVVGKGARLIGHVTNVRQRTGANAESSISLVFDRLETGALEMPLTATITSITRATARTADDDGGLATDTSASSSTRARSSSRQSSNGGLLGGVTGTVGGVVDTTTQTAGSAVNSTTGAVGGAVGSVNRTVGGIRITQSANASAEGSSTLSLTGDNLRLDKGTSFRLVVNEATSAGNNQ
jgi:hypothetical protein